MIITTYGLVVFHLISWIDFDITKIQVVGYSCDMLGIAYPAVPTKHEVPWETMLVNK